MVRSRRQLVAPVAASLLVCSLLAPALVATTLASPSSVEPAPGSSFGVTSQPSSAERLEVAATAQGFEANRTEFHITVYPNGSATWQFRYERTLSSEQERQDFQAFAENFNTNETEMYANFQRRAEALTDIGSNETGRTMNAANFQRQAAVEGFEDNLGVVQMSFRWDGFARTNGRVFVGDVFEGGLYLAPDQRLVVRAGPGLQFAQIRPDDGKLSGETLRESDTVTWGGERSFTDNRPSLELVDEGTTPTPASPSSGTPGWLLPIGVFVIVLLLGLGAAVAYRSGALDPGDGTSSASSSNSPGGDGDGGAAVADASETSTEPAVSDEELVPDDERVVDLLEENGGRMKQVDIVDETGWSKSKVSMLLSDMEEAGDISKLRVGRENIVSLAGHEPDAAGSPFDDE